MGGRVDLGINMGGRVFCRAFRGKCLKVGNVYSIFWTQMVVLAMPAHPEITLLGDVNVSPPSNIKGLLRDG